MQAKCSKSHSIMGRVTRSKLMNIRSNKSCPNICYMFGHCSFSLMLLQHIRHLNKACVHLWSVTRAAFEDVALFHGPCRGRFSGHLRRHAYFGCHLGCYIIVLFTGHGLIISTALCVGEQTDSCRHWSDQVCFSDLAEAIWCILTIIGATATVMFSKPLCYFPGG